MIEAYNSLYLFSWQVMKEFVQLKQIEDVLDKGRAVKHSKLSQLTEEVITDPGKVGP